LRIYEYIIRRGVLLVFVLFGVSLITFYLSRGIPSAFNPCTPFINPKMTPTVIHNTCAAHGFYQPLYLQYFYWLRDVFSGNWGAAGSWANGLPVFQIFASRFPYTVELALTAVIISVVVGLPLGILSAVHNNKPIDHVSRVIALTGISTPVYWFGFILQLVFFYYFVQWGLPNLPDQGIVSQSASLSSLHTYTGIPILDGLLNANWSYAWDAFLHVILPGITLAFASLGALTRLVRASMLEVLRQDYITLARSKGLSERVVIFRHALRNALIPALTVAGLLFAGLLGGAVITETVFNWPGVGYLSVAAVFQGDSNFIMLYTLVTALIVVVANLIVDVLYAVVDPRIRY
jgi:ABC-type dipeptide/oligopeptide/nickel transport system permease component